jgi:mevalonate kinase
MEGCTMSYYNTPEQPIDPPEMDEKFEQVQDDADELVSKIEKLHDKAETFFEELTVKQLEDMFYDAESYLEELEYLSTDEYNLDDEYNSAKWMVEEIEGWFHEKEEAIKIEDK